jgi:hypothetical protein
MTDGKTQKAIKRLKEFELFSEDFETFKGLFFENMKDGKEEEALNLVLRCVFGLLKSDGEKFNELLSKVDKAKSNELKNWLVDSLKKVGGK